MKRLLIYILLLGTITGIIPALCVVLMEKSIVFTILVVLADIYGFYKILCD